MVEHLTRNEKVVSSILTTSSMEKDHREKYLTFPGDFYIAANCRRLFSVIFGSYKVADIRTLSGLLRTPYWAYIGGSMAALIPSMLIYTVIGDKFDFTNPLFWAFVALDALTVVFGFVYAKKNLIDGGKKASEE